MTDERAFYSRADFYEKNIRDASTAKTQNARIEAPDGSHEPAIAVFASDHLRLILPLGDAIRIASEIADKAISQKGNQ